MLELLYRRGFIDPSKPMPKKEECEEIMSKLPDFINEKCEVEGIMDSGAWKHTQKNNMVNASGRDVECLKWLNEIEHVSDLAQLEDCPRKFRAFENKVAIGLTAKAGTDRGPFGNTRPAEKVRMEHLPRKAQVHVLMRCTQI